MFHFTECSTCPNLVALTNLRTIWWSVPTRRLPVQDAVTFRVLLQINSVTDFYKLNPQRYFSRLWKVSWTLFIIFIWRQVRVCFSRWPCTHRRIYRGLSGVSKCTVKKNFVTYCVTVRHVIDVSASMTPTRACITMLLVLAQFKTLCVFIDGIVHIFAMCETHPYSWFQDSAAM